jgi:hypothetical protein
VIQIARSRKGQYTVVEQVVLFGIGLSIASGFLVAFETFGENVKGEARNEQAKVLGEQIGSHVVHLAQTDANGRLRFQLPSTIADTDYTINFTNSGIAIITTGNVYLATLYGLEDKYKLRGQITSQYETGSLVKEGREIRIEGS